MSLGIAELQVELQRAMNVKDQLLGLANQSAGKIELLQKLIDDLAKGVDKVVADVVDTASEVKDDVAELVG